MRPWRMRHWLSALAILLGIVFAGVVAMGEILLAPAKQDVGRPPAELNAVDVTLDSANGLKISAWLSRGRQGAGVVLLVHGVRANRLAMLDRARFLHQFGYSLLLIDLPAHGASDGDRISYGLVEAEAVRIALAFLAREMPHEQIGVIAISLGAAAVVLAEPNPAPSAVVLESMFPTIRDALANRLRRYFGPVGTLLTPLFLWWFELRLDVSARQLAPIDKVAALGAPLLILSGSADANTTVAETEAIFDAASEPKSLWIVPGAAHVDLHAFSPVEYERRVARFLGQYLPPGH
ncbi:MAG: alpha/beta hydrolase [Burkholderiales bacterium]